MPKSTWKTERNAAIVEARRAGDTIREIAAAHGLAVATIHTILTTAAEREYVAAIEREPVGPDGELRASNYEALQMHRAGYSAREIAATLGVTPQRARALVQREAQAQDSRRREATMTDAARERRDLRARGRRGQRARAAAEAARKKTIWEIVPIVRGPFAAEGDDTGGRPLAPHH